MRTVSDQLTEVLGAVRPAAPLDVVLADAEGTILAQDVVAPGDVPAIDVLCLDGADTVANHTGAKGLAEPPIIPTAPAIANAVADALGVEVREIPLTPWRVLGAMISDA